VSPDDPPDPVESLSDPAGLDDLGRSLPRQPEPEPSLPARRSRWGKFAFLLPVLALAYIMSVIRLPYFVFRPGPARDVEPLIHVQEHRIYASRGHLLLTSVSLYQPNLYQVLGAWLSPSEAVVPERDFLAPGQTFQEEAQEGVSQMDQSKIDAAVVALTRYADYPERHGPGALVEFVQAGTPADGKLFAGDLIVEVQGKKVEGADDLTIPIRSAGIGHPVTFTVRAGGKTRTVSIAPARIKGIDHPAIGIATVDNFPFPLTIDSADIGGPSAGLMWTLGLIDLLTPGDLTHGNTIAGTGTIDPQGTVGPIGGIEQKVVGAERNGATIFFAPADEAAAARNVASGIAIVPVRSYTDALAYLQRHP
jgi:PDZ domain-containing protein